MTGSLLASLLAAAAALLVPLLLGRQVVRALAGDALAAALGRAGEWGFAFGAGLTLVGVALGLAYAAHVPAPGPTAAVVALGAWGLLAWRARRRGLPARVAPCSEPPSGPLSRALQLAGWLLLAALLAAVGVASWRTAAGFPDAHLVWLLRGKVLYLDQGFDGSYFRSWQTAHDNRAYPPLVSLATAWMHEFARDADARAAKLLSLAFLAALLAVTHGVLQRALGRGAALALTLALAGCTTLVMLGIWGIADLPLAYQVLCAGALLLVADERLLLRLLAFPVAGAVLTKNEGLPVVLAIAAACALRLLLARRGATDAAGLGRRVARALGRTAAVVAPAVLLLGAWWALAASLGLPLQFMKPEAGVETSASRGQLAELAAHEMAVRVAEPSWLPGWIAFGVVTLLLAVRTTLSRGNSEPGEARSRCLAAATIVLLTGLAYTWVLSGYQGDLPYLLRISAGRLVAHAYPLALVVAACGAAALAGPRAPS